MALRREVLRRGVAWRGVARPAGSALGAAVWTAWGRARQAFAGASAFNQNIGSWNTASVTTFDGAFGSGGEGEGEGEGEGVGLADCVKRSVYDNWGSTLRTAYPSWSSLCSPTPRCESRPVAMRALGTRRIGA